MPQKLENEATIEATSRNPTEVGSTGEAEIPGAWAGGPSPPATAVCGGAATEFGVPFGERSEPTNNKYDHKLVRAHSRLH